MRRVLLLLALTLSLLNVYSQRPVPRVAMFGQFDAHLFNAPFRMYGPDGTQLETERMHAGFNWWKAILGKEELMYGNSSLPSLGFLITMPMIPVGIKANCSFDRLAFKMAYPGESQSTVHIMNGVKPEIDLYYVMGDPTRFFRPAIIAGGAYHCPLSFIKGHYEEDVAMLNKGFEAVVGFSLMIIPGFQGTYYESHDNYTFSFQSSHKNLYAEVGLVYRYAFYNYFNQDYTKGMAKPYEGFTSKYGEVCLRFTMGGFFATRNQR